MNRKIDDNQLLFTTRFIKQKEYWTNKLTGDVPATTLLSGEPGEPGAQTAETGQTGEVPLDLDPDVSARLLKLGNNNDLTVYVILLTGLKALLYRYIQDETVTVVSPVYKGNELHGNLNDRVFVRSGVSGDMSFKQLLLSVRQSVLDAYENQDFPYYKLLETIYGPESSADGSVLSDVVCRLDNIHPQIEGVTAGTALCFSFVHESGKVSGTISYNPAEYPGYFVSRLPGHFSRLLGELLADVNAEIGLASFLPEAEKKQLLHEFNDNNSPFSRDKSIRHFVEQHAADTPESIAIEYRDELRREKRSYTYRELNEAANGLAVRLRDSGVGEDRLAGVMMDRSPVMAASILAVWKAGGAYIPISPRDPEQRVMEILGDSGACVLLTGKENVAPGLDESFNGTVITLPNDLSEMEKEKADPEGPFNMDSLAYVIYTSGSTGKPKGAMVEHIGMMNHIQSKIDDLQLNGQSIVVQNASHTFDISVWQYFVAFIPGGTTLVYPNELVLAAERFVDAVIEDRVTILEVVPSYLAAMMDTLEERHKLPMIYLLVTGEAVQPSLVKRWFEKYPAIPMVNAYGPTEASDDITHHIMDKAPGPGQVPIGKPILNMNIYIVNPAMQLCPVGVKGEIIVSGVGVGRGYLGDEERTKMVFMDDPFADAPGVRMYMTGDLGQWLPDGTIQFFGRKDHQVKIRGYRIELGEIESRLSLHPQVKEVVVIDREISGGGRGPSESSKYLCAYIVAHGHIDNIDIPHMRDFLGEHLPEYMVPAYFVQLEKMPLTPNGKINRKALPEPETTDSQAEYVAPANELESVMANIWAEVLKTGKIGVTDNFFEMGGDSIKAIQISARMLKHGLKAEINDLFLSPTIRELGKQVTRVDRAGEKESGLVEGEVPLSPIQQWFFKNNFTGKHHFNLSLLLTRPRGFDETLVSQSFTRLLEHHDALRMVYRFGETGGSALPVQFNREVQEPLFDLQVKDLGKITGPELEEKIKIESEAVQAGINLETGPLVRLGLFKTGSGDFLLLVVHHLVSDGISLRVLLEDFEVVYRQLSNDDNVELQEKTDSFKYWMQALHGYADGTGEYSNRALLGQLDYWKEIENIEIPALPKDTRVSPAERLMRTTQTLHMELDEALTSDLLKKANQAYRTEINDLLLAALLSAVQQWSGVSAAAVNLEGHGREAIIPGVDVSRTVGWFTSQFPVVLQVPGEGNETGNETGRLVKHVKETMRQIPEKGIGYGLLRYLAPNEMKQDVTFNLEPEISFNYLGQFHQPQGETGGKTGNTDTLFEVSGLDMGAAVSPDSLFPYTLDINGLVAGEKLTLSFTYCSNEYRAETVERLVDAYRQSLSTIVRHCAAREKSEFTPGDFPAASIDSRELDVITEAVPGEFTDIYSLSPLQEGMLFHYMMDRHSNVYFEQADLVLRGKLNLDLFETSFNKIIEKYDILRTLFAYKEIKTPHQVVVKERTAPVYFEDISHKSSEEITAYVDAFKLNDRAKGFELEQDIPMRISIIQTSADAYRILWSFHHIVMDGWCIGIIFKDLVHIYQSLAQGKALVPAPVTPYRRYIRWLAKQDRDAGIDYWKDYLDGYRQTAVLPRLGRVNEGGKGDYQLKEYWFDIGESLTQKLMQLTRERQVTINTVFQSLWGLLLQRYNTANDVIYGAVVSGRPSEIEGIETMVGLFINTIPVRVKDTGRESLIQLLEDMQQNALDSRNNEYLPLADIQAQSPLKGNLIDHILIFENFPIPEEVKAGGTRDGLGFYIESMEMFEQTNYDFNLVVSPDAPITLRFNYNALAFGDSMIQRFKGHIIHLLEQFAGNPRLNPAGIEVLPPAEKEEILDAFNRSMDTSPEFPTVYRSIEDQVRRHPGRVGIVSGDSFFTYGEIDRRSRQVALELRKRGVGNNRVVGIMAERSVETVIGVLGILKAGGAYLPIDPQYPGERIKYILEDSSAAILLQSQGGVNRFDHSFTELLGLRNLKLTPHVTGRREPIADLDRLPVPDRSLVSYQKYNKYIGHAMVKNTITIQATRGCPYNCAYCHKIWPKKHILRSPEHILAEVEIFYSMGIRRFVFIDDIFNLDIKNSGRFFQLVIDRGLDINIFFPNGVRGDILTPEYIDLMVKAGVSSLAVALETASPRLQKLIGKNVNLDKLRDNIQYIADNHPHVILEVFAMHGFPTETEEEARMTLDYLHSLKWVHFPYFFILKIYPNTDMAALAIENGFSEEAIARSANLAYHQLPDTLPFDKSFTAKCQAEFLNRYFLNQERLMHVLPHQLALLTEDELVQKYDSYLPADIRSLDDLLEYTGISRDQLNLPSSFGTQYSLPGLDDQIKAHFQPAQPREDALKVLFLDLSQFFTSDTENMLYDVVEPPLGLMYVMTYLREQLGDRIDGRVAKSRIDFDSFDQLKQMLEEFQPDIIGLRTLTYYKDFFHRTAAMIRQWGFDVPIITGGPYATSDYSTILQDTNVDLVVLSEGEHTSEQLFRAILDNDGKLPGQEVLEKIVGLAYVPDSQKQTGTPGREILFIDQILSRPAPEQTGDFGPFSGSDDMIYTIYTSGSTGRPKGAGVYHKGFANLLHWFNNDFELAAPDRTLLATSLSFDLTQKNLYAPLMTGGELVIPPGGYFDPAVILAQIEKNNVTCLNCTPSMSYQLVEYGGTSEAFDKFQTLRYLFLGGEPISIPLLKPWIESGYFNGEIVNTYGPTECTDICASWRLVPALDYIRKAVPIGKPVYNAKMYVVDPQMRAVPVGVNGELCITGTGVGLGYLNDAARTMEKFVADPFDPSSPVALYRTGDLARWLPDGTVEFLGRMDHQVKIRGFRIELGEIEKQLSAHPNVKESVVIDRHASEDAPDDQDTGALEKTEKYLCAYVVAEPGAQFAENELHDYMAAYVPGYMIPQFFVMLDSIPLTPNGKVNRKALPGPIREAGDDDTFVAASDPVEKELVSIWSRVLGLEPNLIGIDANFFDLGGHSLKATTLVSEIHKHLNVRLPLADIFRLMTIREQALHIKEMDKDVFAALAPAREMDYYPLSSAQKRLYVVQQTDENAVGYNVPLILRLEGELDIKHLTYTLNTVIQRQESLRTSFIAIGGEPFQRIHENAPLTVQLIEDDTTPVKCLIANFIRPFDLSAAPLMRVGLIRLEPRAYVLVMDMHHIITDGVSLGIITHEFMEIYRGKTLPPLKRQYKDFCRWQDERVTSGSLKSQETYWKSVFEHPPAPLNLPTDSPRPSIMGFEGGSYSFTFDQEQTTAIRDLAHREDATLFMVLFAMYGVFLAKLSGQTDIVAGTPTTGRRHPDLEQIIGMFVNTLAIRTRPQEDKSFNRFLSEVKEATLQALENQDYQFEELVELLGGHRDVSRNPLFDAVFVLQNIDIPEFHIPGLTIKAYEEEIEVAKFDLTLTATETDKTITFDLEYSTRLFKPETIERFAGYFREIAEAVTAKSNDLANLLIKDIQVSHDFYDQPLMAPEDDQGDFGFDM